VAVRCYSGVRHAQRPRAFHDGAQWVEILRILDHERISGPCRNDPVHDRYQVLTTRGEIIWLSREGELWYILEDPPG